MSSGTDSPQTPVVGFQPHPPTLPQLATTRPYSPAGMPPDFPIPQPPVQALASPFHPGTTLLASTNPTKRGDRFQDVRKLFARRETQSRRSVRGTCFCGKSLEEEEMDLYCSTVCARADAMKSLCFAETRAHTAESSISSISSITSSTLSATSALGRSSEPLSPSQASHYRRMISDILKPRADRASSRRRRGPTTTTTGSSIGSIASVISTNFNRVPELVGGPYGHSRDGSLASEDSSRHGSVASRAMGLADLACGLGNVQEEDPIERLADADESPAYDDKPRQPVTYATLERAPDGSFGMGKDMQDVLDEIIMMEQGFHVNSSDEEPLTRHIVKPSPTPQPPHRHLPSRSAPSFEIFGPPLVPEGIMSHLPSAFEDADEDPSNTHVARQSRHPPTRRTRSEIRRSLTFIPPKGYRASLLASIQEKTPRGAGHPYARRSALVRPDDSVTMFQFPKKKEEKGVKGMAEDVGMEAVPNGLEPALFPASPVRAPDVPVAEVTQIAAPVSGLRLGVLMGSGVDEDDAWFRGVRGGGEAMDVETP